MGRRLHRYALVLTIASTLAKEPDLPLCPTNILQYFPQSLPMHCRMPTNAENLPFPPLPMMPPPPLPLAHPPPPSYRHSATDKTPKKPIPIPFPPMPGPMPMMPMPMPGPMPGPIPGPAHKMPLIVMPFYSPDNSYKKPQRPPKKKKPRFHDSDSSCGSDDSSTGLSSDDSSSFEDGYWKGRKISGRRSGKRHNRRHSRKTKKQKGKKDLLTPILQYVTKDGYVIYEKKISKDEAKDWLHVKKDDTDKKEHMQVKETKNEGSERKKNNDNSAEEEDNGNASVAEVMGKRNISKENKIDIVTKKVPPKIHSHRKAKLSKHAEPK